MGTSNDLAGLLRASARGDREAFRRFYDATSGRAFQLELIRARARGVPFPREVAERSTLARFVRAWQDAPAYATSGLSPLAWLLGLPTDGVADRLGDCMLGATA